MDDGTINTRNHKKELSRLMKWVKSKVKNGRARMDLWRELMNEEDLPLETLMARSEVAKQIQDVVVNRNIEGIRLEKEGKIKEAIALYEANVKDCFDGSHPYNRLRIIYANMEDYSNAIRVIEICLAMNILGEKDRVKFERHLAELKVLVIPKSP